MEKHTRLTARRKENRKKLCIFFCNPLYDTTIMTRLRRFLAVCHGEKPDYVPIFGHPWAPGMSGGCLKTTYDHLRRSGMPDVGGGWDPAHLDQFNLQGWADYWGTDSPMELNFFPGQGGPGIRSQRTVRDGFEFIEYDTGALTRQYIDNDISYGMPDFIRYHVRDRESFEHYKALNSPTAPWATEQIAQACLPYANRTRPLWVMLHSSWGALRGTMGPEAACTVLYDDPELAEEFLEWLRWINREFLFPLIRQLKPEAVIVGEDFCYNHGMFISAEHFNRFCAPTYREIGEVVKAAGVPAFVIDSDGFVEPALPLVVPLGVNALLPWEVKAGNDLDRVRDRYPELIMFGGIEKESVNAGNTAMIRPVIDAKRPLIRGGRYFPNGDHGLQSVVDFENLCKFMTRLHEVTENPEGTFPRMQP